MTFSVMDIFGRVAFAVVITSSVGYIASPAASKRESIASMHAQTTSDCTIVRANARRSFKVFAVTDSSAPPVARTVVAPPIPVPAAVRGAHVTFTVRVDSAGAPLQGTATLDDIADASFEKHFLVLLLRARYKPAMLNGCTVEGTYTKSFVL